MWREEVGFRLGDASCAAWLYRPDRDEGHVLCVVMGSGFSCVRDQRLDSVAERFAAAGFAALAFDYRHFGASEGRPRQLLDARRQQEDWRAALAFSRSIGGVDGTRIALWGYSLGGGHAQFMAATQPDVSAVICVAPVIDGVRSLVHVGGVRHLLQLLAPGVKDQLRATRRAQPHTIPAAGPPGSLSVLNSPGALPGFEAITPPGSTWRNEICARFALRRPYRPGRRAAQIRCPILYCIAEDDDVNPPKLGIDAADRAPLGELRRYPGGHFDPLLGDVFEHTIVDQLEFLRRHLLETARPSAIGSPSEDA